MYLFFVLCYSFEVYFTVQKSICFKCTIQRFTKLCNHYHNLIWEHFHYPKRNLVFLCLLLSPGNRQSIYCLYGSASGDISHKGIIESMAFHIWKLLRSSFEVYPCWSMCRYFVLFTAQGPFCGVLCRWIPPMLSGMNQRTFGSLPHLVIRLLRWPPCFVWVCVSLPSLPLFFCTGGLSPGPLHMLSIAGLGFLKQFHLRVQVVLELEVFLFMPCKGWNYKCAP